jgi:putative redox protein
MIAKNELQNYLTKIIGSDIIVDTTKDKGGTGAYIRPHELLEAALAACMNISIRMEALKNNIKLDDVETKVELNRTDPAKSIFEYSFKLNSDPKNDGEVLGNFKNALQHCAVRKTLSKEIVFVEK